MKKAIALALPLALASLTVYVFARELPRGRQASTVEGPKSWVPYTATFRMFGPNGEIGTAGTIRRWSDGSYRWDGTTPFKGRTEPLVGVVIHNIGRQLSYRLRPGETDWTSHPIDLGGRPHIPRRAMAAAGVSSSTETIAGQSTVVRVKNNERTYYAPALNFDHVKRVVNEKTNEEYTSVVIGEPEAALLEPPAGATVVHDPTKSLFYWKKPPLER